MLRYLSGIFLIIGAIIGGGIVAIPIVSAQYGFLTTLIFMIAAWAIMTKTGLYVLDLSLSCPGQYNSYFSIVGKYLGDKMQLVTVIFFLWLLYFSLASYISGCTALITNNLVWSRPWFSHSTLSLVFVITFGTLIVLGGKLIVRLNVLLVSAKLVLLSVAVVLGTSVASQAITTHWVGNYTGAMSLLMVIVNAFGYQFIIPSLVSYHDLTQRNHYQWIIIASTTTVLYFYIAWLYTIYTIIPLQGQHGLISIYQSNNQLLAFNQSLQFYLHSNAMTQLIATFQIVALFGSFFCVALSVFDFLADVFKSRNCILIGLATFVPPLLLALFSENMYSYAMSMAGYIAVLLEIIIPLACYLKR